MSATDRDIAQAFDFLAAQLAPVTRARRVPLAGAHSRVLAEALVAGADLPAHDEAAMDGYALRSADAQHARTELELAGRALAGHPFAGPAGPGRCVRIMTGTPVPKDCDAVVMQEHVAVSAGGRVTVPGPVAPGLNCRRRGEHVAAGSTALTAGRWLRPPDLALACALGAHELRVFRALRVGVLSTGDELRAPPARLRAGTAYDGNRPMIVAALASRCFAPFDLGICADDSKALARRIDAAFARSLDVVLISGGSAQGDADVVRLLPGVSFLPMRFKPGRGVAWARLERAGRGTRPRRRLLLLGLPGNSVAAYLMFLLLARPLLAHFAGAVATRPAAIALPLAADVSNRAGRVDYRRARLVTRADGATAVELLPEQGSAMIRTVSAADALVAVGPQAAYRAGDLLACYLLDAFAAP